MSKAKEKKSRFAAIAANISSDPSARDDLKLAQPQPAALSAVAPIGQGATPSAVPAPAQGAPVAPPSAVADPRREPPTHSPGLRLNTREVAMLRRLAEASGHRQQHILRSLVVRELERAVAKLDENPDIFRAF